jgi:hypothetical protein
VSNLSDLLLGGGGATVGSGFVFLVGRHLVRIFKRAILDIVEHALGVVRNEFASRFDDNDAASKAAAALAGDVRLEFVKQFGGNSNGIRQAVNAIAADVTVVRSDVANLRGAFEQHVKEGGK